MKHKLTAQELGSFCRQLGILIHSGMGPLESLHILLEESTTDTDREVLSNLLSSMEKTGSLSQAVTDSGFFPNSMAAYIKTGEQTGCLDEILDSLSGHYEQEQETSGQIRSAVTYPLLMLVKGLLESRNGGVVPLIQLGNSFIVDADFEVALLCLDYGMAYTIHDVVRAPVGSHKCHFR